MTLRTRLTVAFVLVVLVPILVGALLVAHAIPRTNTARQGETVTSSARLIATVLAGYCDRAHAVAEDAGHATAGAAGAVGDRVVRDLVARRLADGVRVVARTGASVATAGDVPPVSQAVDCGTGARVPYLGAVVKLTTGDGREAGTSVAAFRIDRAFVLGLQQVMGRGDVALLSGAQVVASSGRVSDAVLAAAQRSPNTVVRSSRRLAFLSPARPAQPYGVLVALPLARGPGLFVVALAVLVGAVLLAASIAWLLARATTRPLEELVVAASRIAGGDLDTPLVVRSTDEVGRLALAFNDMTADLRTYVRALEASRDELQVGLARLGDTLSSTHDLDRILSVVLETAMVSTRAQAGMVLLFNPSRDELVLSVARGMTERGVPEGLRVPVGLGVSGRAAQSGEPVVGRLGSAPGQLRPGPNEPVEGSIIAVPLKSSGTVIGVLDLFDRLDANSFDERDVATIRTFASQATVAVDNVLLHQEAQRLSITDGLTGLWNYRYFTMTVGKEIERAARFGRPLALLMLDLDYFKQVNDTYGHQRGDAVLIELASRVRAQVRDVDTVARYGGEEVVVILPETDEAGAIQAAERICDAVRRRPFGDPGQRGVHVTVSVGAAIFPGHGTTAGLLLRRADEALYEAKAAGRDTWRLTAVPPVSGLPH